MSYSITKTICGFQIDAFGHVNNARYLELYEEARWIIYKQQIDALVAKGFAFVIVNIDINYRLALNLLDEVEITVNLTQISRRSAVIEQQIRSLSGDKVYSDMKMTFVMMDLETKKSIVFAEDEQLQAIVESMRTVF